MRLSFFFLLEIKVELVSMHNKVSDLYGHVFSCG